MGQKLSRAYFIKNSFFLAFQPSLCPPSLSKPTSFGERLFSDPPKLTCMFTWTEYEKTTKRSANSHPNWFHLRRQSLSEEKTTTTENTIRQFHPGFPSIVAAIFFSIGIWMFFVAKPELAGSHMRLDSTSHGLFSGSKNWITNLINESEWRSDVPAMYE